MIKTLIKGPDRHSAGQIFGATIIVNLSLKTMLFGVGVCTTIVGI